MASFSLTDIDMSIKETLIKQKKMVEDYMGTMYT